MPSNITALSLLAHPLLARLNLGEDGRPVRWECHAKVQEPEGFTLATRPPLPVAQPAADLDWQNMAHESRMMVLCALEANRVTPLSGFCALVDTRDRTVHHVDFLAERDGRPCLVLVYYTQQRARASRDLDAIARQCQCLRRLNRMRRISYLPCHSPVEVSGCIYVGFIRRPVGRRLSFRLLVQDPLSCSQALLHRCPAAA